MGSTRTPWVPIGRVPLLRSCWFIVELVSGESEIRKKWKTSSLISRVKENSVAYCETYLESKLDFPTPESPIRTTLEGYEEIP
ncbi:hypothetical protein HWI79_3245 [Cryptosporidium felis]|nr:hypothetical protein HWI79_3245 [Cryptosporidium felis]